jgi:hypothetical protein
MRDLTTKFSVDRTILDYLSYQFVQSVARHVKAFCYVIKYVAPISP